MDRLRHLGSVKRFSLVGGFMINQSKPFLRVRAILRLNLSVLENRMRQDYVIQAPLDLKIPDKSYRYEFVLRVLNLRCTICREN